MPPKLVVRECTPDRCQTASRLSAASDVMSIRRTDKHCGARLVAAPASPLSRPFRPPSRLCAATLPSNLLSPSLSRPFLPPLSFSLAYFYAPYIDVRGSPPPPASPPPRHSSLLLSNSIRGASALASSDSVPTTTTSTSVQVGGGILAISPSSTARATLPPASLTH